MGSVGGAILPHRHDPPPPPVPGTVGPRSNWLLARLVSHPRGGGGQSLILHLHPLRALRHRWARSLPSTRSPSSRGGWAEWTAPKKERKTADGRWGHRAVPSSLTAMYPPPPPLVPGTLVTELAVLVRTRRLPRLPCHCRPESSLCAGLFHLDFAQCTSPPRRRCGRLAMAPKRFFSGVRRRTFLFL